jgi:DNA-binding MarR family transcriptional regulator
LKGEDEVSAISEDEIEQFERLVMRMIWRQHQRLGRMLGEWDLTLPRLLVLGIIDSRPDCCTMGQLADATEQCSATMTGIVDRLARMGLVERHRDPNDRRSVLVQLTERGRALVHATKEMRAARTRRVLSQFTPDERSEVIRLLQRTVDTLEEESTSAPR